MMLQIPDRVSALFVLGACRSSDAVVNALVLVAMWFLNVVCLWPTTQQHTHKRRWRPALARRRVGKKWASNMQLCATDHHQHPLQILLSFVSM